MFPTVLRKEDFMIENQRINSENIEKILTLNSRFKFIVMAMQQYIHWKEKIPKE